MGAGPEREPEAEARERETDGKAAAQADGLALKEALARAEEVVEVQALEQGASGHTGPKDGGHERAAGGGGTCGNREVQALETLHRAPDPHHDGLARIGLRSRARGSRLGLCSRFQSQSGSLLGSPGIPRLPALRVCRLLVADLASQSNQTQHERAEPKNEPDEKAPGQGIELPVYQVAKARADKNGEDRFDCALVGMRLPLRRLASLRLSLVVGFQNARILAEGPNLCNIASEGLRGLVCRGGLTS